MSRNLKLIKIYDNNSLRILVQLKKREKVSMTDMLNRTFRT